ncbi:MAG: PAS domain-containing protein [Comamonadaceae bacterium]|nr:PAS domain-containing protein [Comamonadaceae bacterium]
MKGQPLALRLREAVDRGELGLWDLRPELETVHYSPQWKQRLGFPEPYSADSTHFWRCRVHPDDLDAMLAALRAHTRGAKPWYEATFRLRSNGSGYRVVRSWGRVIAQTADGRTTRMLGTMLDLTPRPCTPRGGLPEGPRSVENGAALEPPFHELLSVWRADEGADTASAMSAAAAQVLHLLDDVLRATLAQLDGLRAPRRPVN